MNSLFWRTLLFFCFTYLKQMGLTEASVCLFWSLNTSPYFHAILTHNSYSSKCTFSLLEMLYIHSVASNFWLFISFRYLHTIVAYLESLKKRSQNWFSYNYVLIFCRNFPLLAYTTFIGLLPVSTHYDICCTRIGLLFCSRLS